MTHPLIRPPMSREAQKDQRRQALVDAAEALIRETGSTDFSMLVLAQRARLSPTTPYNLFGTKSAILYALLRNSADRIFDSLNLREASRDPWLRTLQSADALADALVSDPSFYQPLYRFLFGVVDPVYRPAFMSRTLRYWEDAVASLVAGGFLPPGLTQRHFAGQFVIQAIGAVDLWVQYELDADQLAAQLRHGSCLLLLGLAPAPHRERLLALLTAAAARLPSQPG